MHIGNRRLSRVLRAPLKLAHYRALLRMVLLWPALASDLRRYLTGGGSYPCVCRVRTPSGIVAPTLHHSHDISTVVEVFFRADYRSGSNVGVVVDIGANIGISALYFLSRNTASRVYCFEPNPTNVARLRVNLADFDSGRFDVEEVAVGLHDGDASFGTEPTGRYGRISDDFGELITVRCREINSVLGEVINREGAIDVLKIDVEGLEEQLVGAIRPDLLAKITTIYYETVTPAPLHADRFRHHFSCQVNTLRARVDAGGAHISG